ncbi:MAG: hypothetical protein HRF49_09225 [bacterium]|jgi:hypothetical protein
MRNPGSIFALAAGAAALLLAGCGGGSGFLGLGGQPDRTPNIAGTWTLTETTTDDPSGNSYPGETKTFDLVIEQDGENFTITAPTVEGAPKGHGTINGNTFTFEADYSFGASGGTYSVDGWVTGSLSDNTLTGHGVIDLALIAGTDRLGLHGVRISFNWSAAKKA